MVLHLHTRYYRQWRDISLTAFARAIGMAPASLSEKERGLEPYTLPQLGRTVQGLQVPLRYLIEVPFLPGDEGDTIPLPPRENLISIPCGPLK